MSGSSDRDLDAESRRILESIDELRRLEARKRRTQRSSGEFHALAEEITDRARDVWHRTALEEQHGEEDSPLREDRESSGPGDWTRGSRD